MTGRVEVETGVGTGSGAVAVVPVRSLRGGKTRLAETLPVEAREALSRRMLGHVLDRTLASGAVERVVVVSPDPAALAAAAAADPRVAAVSQPPERPGLNAALDLGRACAVELGAASLLVLFADLPLLETADVRALAGAAEPVAIAPDRHGTGTNALALRLAGAGRGFGFAFGVGSAARHLAEADRLGLEVATVARPGLSFDLDTAEDWRSFVDAGAATILGLEPELALCCSGIAP